MNNTAAAFAANSARVRLVGLAAEALAPRLQASGYRIAAAAAGEPADLVLVARAEAAAIPDLRRRYGSVPLLLDGGEDTVEARALSLGSGADDAWYSSLPPSDLLVRLRLHLDLSRRAQQPAPLLQLADLSLNPSRHQVKRGSREVALTAREYALLLLLLERKGTVVSRDQILRQVWNNDQRSSSNVIEVYVRYLRQKLEAGGERRLIHTIRGQGYCLSEGIPPLEPH